MFAPVICCVVHVELHVVVPMGKSVSVSVTMGQPRNKRARRFQSLRYASHQQAHACHFFQQKPGDSFNTERAWHLYF